MINIIFIVITFLAVGFAWQMRGDLIGGEEGAMFPGAILGLCIAMFSPNPEMKEFFYIPVALGMFGMFFGGTEPYGETFGFTFYGDTIKDKPSNPLKGYLGLMVKGAPWFGICASVIGVGICSFTYYNYHYYDFLALFMAIGVSRYVGAKFINAPYHPKRGKFPKIYFSEESREEWGSLWLILLSFVVLELIHKDYFSLRLTLCGAITGSIGWVIAQMVHVITKVKFNNGKYIFGKLQEKGYVNNWKLMEFLYGGLGSLGITFGIVTQNDYISSLKFDNIRIYNDTNRLLLIYIFIFLFDIGLNMFAVRYKKRSAYIPFHRMHDYLHRPIICGLPLLMILCGQYNMARLSVLGILPYLPFDENAFYQLPKLRRNTLPYQFVSLSIAGVLCVAPLFIDLTPTIYFGIICLDYIALAGFHQVYRYFKLNGKLRVFKTIKEMKSFQMLYFNYFLIVGIVGLSFVIFA